MLFVALLGLTNSESRLYCAPKGHSWGQDMVARSLLLLRVLLIVVSVVASVPPRPAQAASIVVDSTANSGPGTLRSAILASNASVGVKDTITFNLTGGSVIALTSSLPPIEDPVTVEGAGVTLDGQNVVAAQEDHRSGLAIVGGDTTIRGLTITRFPDMGILIIGVAGSTGPTPGNNVIEGTTIIANGIDGIQSIDSSSNRIGGPLEAQRNIISSNSSSGVRIAARDHQSQGNIVQNNYIGSNSTGIAAQSNGDFGIWLDGVSSSQVVGNLLSGNVLAGLYISNGGSSTLVQGNRIGTNSVGGAALANGEDGVIVDQSNETQILGNVVSGNAENGITIQVGGTGNVVRGNLVGTNADGSASLPNGRHGVAISSASGNTIGGTAVGARNVISGNTADGVSIQGMSSTNNLVQGNLIGLNSAGTVAVGNANGISILEVSGNTIGGMTEAARNVISGNRLAGVTIQDGSANNAVLGNYIGTNATGTAALGNEGSGLFILDAPDNTVGGTVAGVRNVISGNELDGVHITGTGSTGNMVQGNYIGTDATGTAPLGNFDDGVDIREGAKDNTVGGTAAGARNVLADNFDGVHIEGAGTTGNVVQGNYVGTDVSGTEYLGNYDDGVEIGAGAANNVIGGAAAAARNVISGNDWGVYMTSAGAGNRIQGNYIGPDVSGATALGNFSEGIWLFDSPGTIIGGTDDGTGNVISGNDPAITLEGTATTGTMIQGNIVGLNAAGTDELFTSAGIVLDGARATTVGGTTPAARNILSGGLDSGVAILGQAATGNVVSGNYIGTDANGTTDFGNVFAGVFIAGAPNTTIGGTAAGAGNLISGNLGAGVWIDAATAANSVVQGNHIGTTADGTSDLGNVFSGVAITNEPPPEPTGAAGVRFAERRARFAERKVRSARQDADADARQARAAERRAASSARSPAGSTIERGASVDQPSPAERKQGIPAADRIRRALAASPRADVRTGERVRANAVAVSATGVTIGGTDGGAGNTIAFNGFGGVQVFDGAGHSVLGNSIHSNGDLGIDLGFDGVTPNDPGDADEGPNDFQSFPVLTTATSGAGTALAGTLNAAPNATFRVELFSSPQCDPSGHGEGRVFLAARNVATAASGNGSFALNVPRVAPGHIVTATATNPSGSTSEFSACQVVAIAGISITPVTRGLETNEAGGSATFRVALTTKPVANVTIPLRSSNPAEGSVQPAALTFTPDNAMTPQTVTVTGVADSTPDGDVPYMIVTDPATSEDASYNGLNAEDVQLMNRDVVQPGCANRPAITVRSAPNGDGRLRVTVTASRPAQFPGNVVQSFHFKANSTNAAVDIDQVVSRAGAFVHPLAPNTVEKVFFVRRLAPGQAATLHFDVVDACGPWSTFVGGGAQAF